MIAPVPGDEARVGPTEWTGRRGEGDSGERGGGECTHHLGLSLANKACSDDIEGMRHDRCHSPSNHTHTKVDSCINANLQPNCIVITDCCSISCANLEISHQISSCMYQKCRTIQC